MMTQFLLCFIQRIKNKIWLKKHVHEGQPERMGLNHAALHCKACRP